MTKIISKSELLPIIVAKENQKIEAAIEQVISRANEYLTQAESLPIKIPMDSIPQILHFGVGFGRLKKELNDSGWNVREDLGDEAHGLDAKLLLS